MRPRQNRCTCIKYGCSRKSKVSCRPTTRRSSAKPISGGLAGWAQRFGEESPEQRAVRDGVGSGRDGEARTEERSLRLRSGSARQRKAERNETGCGRWCSHQRGENRRAHRCGQYRGAALRSGLKVETALRPACMEGVRRTPGLHPPPHAPQQSDESRVVARSEEHTSELQSLAYLVCRLLLETKNKLHSVT